MADEILEWVGNAAPVAQVDTITVTLNAAQTYDIKINEKSVQFVHDGTGTEETIVDGLVAAWNANPFPECTDAVAGKASTTTLTLTSSIPGTPFVATVGPNLSIVNTTVASGPNHWGQPENYINRTTGATTGVPALNDEVHIRENRPAILYNLDVLSTITLKQMVIDQPMQNAIGLPDQNVNGYFEYRQRMLTQPITTLVIGRGNGAGSPRIQIALEAATCAATIHQTGGQIEPDRRPVQLENANGTDSTLDIRGGSVDVNRNSASKGGFDTINVSGGECRVWPSFNTSPVSTSTLTVSDTGTLIIGASCNAIGKGGQMTLADNAVIDAITINGPCNVVAQLAGNIQTLTMDHPNAVIDCAGHPHPITIAAWNITRGTIRDPNAIITWTAGGVLPKGVLTFSEN